MADPQALPRAGALDRFTPALVTPLVPAGDELILCELAVPGQIILRGKLSDTAFLAAAGGVLDCRLLQVVEVGRVVDMAKRIDFVKPNTDERLIDRRRGIRPVRARRRSRTAAARGSTGGPPAAGATPGGRRPRRPRPGSRSGSRVRSRA